MSNAKRISMIISGIQATCLVYDSDLETFLHGLLKNVYKTVTMTSVQLPTRKVDDTTSSICDKVMITSCRYRRAEGGWEIIAKARDKEYKHSMGTTTLMTAKKMRLKIKAAGRINLAFWSEIKK